MTDPDPLVSPAKNGRPDPDPTLLTTQALFREIAQLRELFNTKIDTITHTVEASLENATNARTGIREILNQRIDALSALFESKLDLIERQRVEQKSDTAAAVQAALSAAKEAVKEQTNASERSIAKSEAATSKQLEAQQVTTASAAGELRRSIDDLKERIAEVDRNLRDAVGAVATTANGMNERRTGAKDDRTAVYAAAGFIATLLGIVGFVIGNLVMRP